MAPPICHKYTQQSFTCIPYLLYAIINLCVPRFSDRHWMFGRVRIDPAGWGRTDTNMVQKVQVLVRIDWMSVGTKWLDSWPAGLRLGNSPCSTPGLSQLRRSTHQGAHKTARCAKKVRTGSVRKGNSCLLFRERKDSLVLDRCIQYWNNTGTRLNIYFGWQV